MFLWVLFVLVISSSVVCFGQDQYISISGNNKTKSDFIQSLLTMSEIDWESSEFSDQIQQSRQNLLNTQLFNSVEITHNGIDTIWINVTERWYLWPEPSADFHETNLNTWIRAPRFSDVTLGLALRKYNFLGRGQSLAVTSSVGYVQSLGLSYDAPFVKKGKLGVSASFRYRIQSEFVYTTENNERVFFQENGDRVVSWLEGQTALRMNISFRSHIKLTIANKSISLSDSLSSLNEVLPENANQGEISEVSAYYRSDHRDYRPFPLEGTYFQVGLASSITDFTNSYTRLETDIRYFSKVSQKGYLGVGFRGVMNLRNNLPYLLTPHLGVTSFVRGYEYAFIDANDYAVAKVNLKFEVLNKVKKIQSISDSRFNVIPIRAYFTVFADAGFGSAHINHDFNSYQNQLLTGFGIGFNAVTAYDRVLRIEGAFNNVGKGGVYLHFTQPI